MFVERGTRVPGARVAASIAIGVMMMAATGCAAVEDAIGSESDDTVEDAATTTVAAPTTAPPFDQATYCSLSHEADQLNAAFSDFADPVALEGFIGDLVGLLEQASPPPEVEGQFQILRTAYIDLQAELAASGFDSSVLTTSPILSDATVNGAITAVDEHDLALCGPAPAVETETETDDVAGGDAGGDTSTDPFSEALASGDFTAMEEILRTEVGREAFIEGFIGTSPGVTAEQAGCFLDNTDIAVLAEMSVNPDDLSAEAVSGFLATLETCEIPLSAFQSG